jgi:isopropylmalate/homocitrate/citramalate synthase
MSARPILEVVFLPVDFSRAELKLALDLIERVGKEGHMDALALVDTFGVLNDLPNELEERRQDVGCCGNSCCGRYPRALLLR